ncbi:hypothetical protein DFQ30_002020 [Apophysomyces sp. BC1015]|nr:hypothetical protein DFQ30_002020 [Apophysomyces sp. BC1015]
MADAACRCGTRAECARVDSEALIDADGAYCHYGCKKGRQDGEEYWSMIRDTSNGDRCRSGGRGRWLLAPYQNSDRLSTRAANRQEVILTQEQKAIRAKVGILELARQFGNELSHHRPIIKNRVDPQVEAAVVDLALELPAYGQIHIANEIRKRHALSVSP